MIRRGAAPFEHLHVAPRVRRHLGEIILQHIRSDESGATTSDEIPVLVEQPKCQGVQPSIAAQRFLDRMARARELGRIKHD